MKPSEIAQLQELSKCYMSRSAMAWVRQMLVIAKWDKEQGGKGDVLPKGKRNFIRHLTNRYRHQIAAIRRNHERN